MTTRSPLLARALVFGFATSLAGWIVAYALRLPGAIFPPVALGLAIILIQVSGATLAGRSAKGASPWLAGLATGIVTSILNLLIVLSAFAGEAASEQEQLHPLYAIAAYLPLGAILGAIGGAIGGRIAKQQAATEPNWLGRFAIVNTVGAFLLLVVGGIVTSADVGLAVPDWPASFGANMFLFPLSKMTGGVFIEHAHRLLAVLVALTTAALLVWTLLSRVSSMAKLVAIVASVLVISQAIMGGLRVTQADAPAAIESVEVVEDQSETDVVIEEETALADNATSRILRLTHGVVGQIYVASLALLAALLSTTWRTGPAPVPNTAAAGQRVLNVLALIALIVQIGFGAAVRHFDLQSHALMSHIGWSVIVLILLLAAGVRAQKQLGSVSPILRRSATATKHTVLLQMALGVVALISAMKFHDVEPPPALYIALRSPHQAIGCLLLITTTLLTAWTIRLTRSAPANAPAST